MSLIRNMIYTTQHPISMIATPHNHTNSSQAGSQNNEADLWAFPTSTKTPVDYSELKSVYQLSKDNGRRRRWLTLQVKYRDVYPRDDKAWQLAMTATK
jgi:hypothetical protein